MQQIKSEAELYKHLASMNLDDPVSTVYLPNIGKFEIFFTVTNKKWTK